MPLVAASGRDPVLEGVVRADQVGPELGQAQAMSIRALNAAEAPYASLKQAQHADRLRWNARTCRGVAAVGTARRG